MTTMIQLPRLVAAFAFAACLLPSAFADEAAIRKTFAERLPDFPKIDEVTKTALPGIYELRVGNEVLYTDEQGNYVIEGKLIDTKSRINLTDERVGKLTAIDFKSLPLHDAMVWKQGNGDRKLVVFADPNCGFCKKFERETLQQMKDVTVYTFLYPILGGDSPEKSKAIWCSKDKATVWRDWMIKGTPIAPAADCDVSALSRNYAFARAHGINGTPGLVFEDGRKISGALGTDALEKQFGSTRARNPG